MDQRTSSVIMDSRPEPKDLTHHLSRVTKARNVSMVKRFYKYFQIPGIGQLAGGLPNSSYFPFDTLEATVARPARWEPTPNKPVDPPLDDAGELAQLSLSDAKSQRRSPSRQQLPQDAIEVPHTSTQTDPVRKIDIDTALQYGQAQGYPPLAYFVRQLTRDHLHPNCPYRGGPETILTCGNTDGLSKCLEAFTNTWSAEKDWIRDREGLLTEKYTFMSAVQQAKPRGLNIVAVEIDSEGMLVEGRGGLKDVLDNWDFTRGKRPRLMYTITMGQNPTSGVLSLQRRREIYAQCQKYDIIIVEDDPYWYLQYPSATAANTTTTLDAANTSFNPDVPMFTNAEPRPEGWKSSGYKFLDSLVPSSINIDTDGRVVRLDTFSKTVAPGCRLGWITAQPALVDRFLRIAEATTQQPSGFVQSMIAELVLGPDHKGLEDPKSQSKGGKGGLPDGKGWKADGWIRWLEGLRGNYERRMNEMCRVLEEGKYLVKSGRRNSLIETAASAEAADEWSVVEKTQLYSFDWPSGGMFLWMKMHFETHPLYHSFKKSGDLPMLGKALWVFWTTKPHLVLAGPGTMFAPTPEIEEESAFNYFRLCFAGVENEDIKPVTERVATGSAAFWKIKDRRTIEKLAEELDEESIAANAIGHDSEGLAQLVGFC